MSHLFLNSDYGSCLPQEYTAISIKVVKKNKTIDTLKIVNILFNVSTSLQSSSGMTLLRNAERYIYKLSGSNYALIKYHKFLRGSSSVVKFWFLAVYM